MKPKLFLAEKFELLKTLWIQPLSSRCGYREDKQGNEKLKAGLYIQIFGNSFQVQVCGHRLDRKGNKKLNARIIKNVFGYGHKVQACMVTDKTGSVENTRLIEVVILVVDYVDNFWHSGLRMDHLDDNLCPPVALFLVK
ncbi:hypothetical protein ACROYT_G021056 [Oculina patagonica]